MTFTQWWRKRIRKADLRFVSPEGLAIYRAMCAEAWNAAQTVHVARFPLNGKPPTETHERDHGFADVTIDAVPKRVRWGCQSVKDLKAALGVNPDYEIDRVLDREEWHLDLLDDAAQVNVQNGDVFVSHVRRGASA